MGRIKTPREFGDPDYIRIDQAVFKLYKIEEQGLQGEQAHLSGLSFIGKPMKFDLHDEWGYEISESYKKIFGTKCQRCGMKPICNGCSNCGKCG